MKKMVAFVMFVIMAVFMVSANAEPASTWYEANTILEEYAKNNGLDWWIERHYDAETKTKFELLTGNKQFMLEEYGFDWDTSNVKEFEKLYLEEAIKNLPDSEVKIEVVQADVYKDTAIYELLIVANTDLEPEHAEEVLCGRAYFVMY